MTALFGLLARIFGGGLLTYLIEGSVIVSVLGGAYLYVSKHYENIGYAKAMHAIAVQDQDAINEAAHAKSDVNDCFNGGGTWNISDGVCVNPSKP